jgi:hypothetical protein
MSNEIQDVETPPDDEALRRDGPANPDDPRSAVEPKRPAPISDPAAGQAKRKTSAVASPRKRRKRFVL